MEKGCLYLCATPIGNLEDISIRALNTLKSVDIIACEDTRHSLKMLNHFEISKTLISYHEHNKIERGNELICELKSGKNIALVTDAGTPAISDPGQDLVEKCISENIRVIPIPGPVALINALIISGQDTQRFSFEGFLSVNRKNRDLHLTSIAEDERTLIFYEAPHKLVRTLEDLYKYLGDRSITIIKEITKIHETAVKTTLKEAVNLYRDVAPKGEFVLVIAGKSADEKKKELMAEFEDMDINSHVSLLISKGMDKKEAIKQVAKLRTIPKRDVYNSYTKSAEVE